MALYKLAVRTDNSFDEIRHWLEGYDASGWCVREVAEENEHWHWFIETKTKPQSFRVLIKRHAPELRGNGSYSVAEVRDEDKYLRYMAKGDGPDLMCEVYWTKGPSLS